MSPETAPFPATTNGTAAVNTPSANFHPNSPDERLQHDEQGDRLLRLYHLYRLTVALVLVVGISSGLHHDLLQLVDRRLFYLTSGVYLIFNLLTGVLQPRPARGAPMFLLVLSDVALLSLLFYEAGGVASGLGSLLVISVAISNALLQGRVGLVIAALASIALVGLTFYLSLLRPSAANHYMQAGALGILCFASALLIQALSSRIRRSEHLARQRAADMADLQALNALILQHMHTGILVTDPQQRILLANPSSQRLLGHDHLNGTSLAHCCPDLIRSLEDWQRNPALPTHSFQSQPEGPLLQPGFAPLPRQNEMDTLIFLEDVSQITQQAQQIKLASLGRLTASIAHEIRNPLGAVSHAAQLLQEAENLSPPDRRLTQIILDHSRRMNLIVENVLQLSRRRQAEPEPIQLASWLQDFQESLQAGLASHESLQLQCDCNVQTLFDPEQLSQVLTNLIQNGLRHSAKRHAQACVRLHLLLEPERQLPVLEVLDDGEGIPAELQSSLFEPFFTTENKGTGLGLYISRELCESNRARLDYLARDTEGACFRITFAQPTTTS